jgi:hypothetical protein
MKNKVSPMAASMSVDTMKKCIIKYLDDSDSMARTIYEILFFKKNGCDVEIRVGDSDFMKEIRSKEKSKFNEKVKKNRANRIKSMKKVR